MQAMHVVQERRRVQRMKVLKTAKIILNHHSSIYDCTVRNLTNLGACLELESTKGIPVVFDLTFDSARTCRPCRTIWRTNHKVGVSFE
jgi:ribosomal protein S1